MSESLTIDTIRDNKKKIEELIQLFAKSIEKNICEDQIVDVFHKISFYTHDFFINEELFMKKYEMPNFSQHVKEHQDFADKMIYFQKEFEQGKTSMCLDLLSYLQMWYDKHILYSDEKIIKYIDEK